MEEKYYVPDLREFHYGFRYELMSPTTGKWYSKFFTDFPEPGAKVRVKLLDREDIESLGWEYDNESDQHLLKCFSLSGSDGVCWDLYWVPGAHVTISPVDDGDGGSIYDYPCKNVSKLAQIMEDIGVKRGEKTGDS